MASGFGFQGGSSRCFRHWQDFQKCYAKAESPYQCVAEKEDYMECLHHTKEIQRATTIRDTFLARKAHEAHHNREKGELRATSSVLRLGIIGAAGDDSIPSPAAPGAPAPGAQQPAEVQESKGQSGGGGDSDGQES